MFRQLQPPTLREIPEKPEKQMFSLNSQQNWKVRRHGSLFAPAAIQLKQRAVVLIDLPTMVIEDLFTFWLYIPHFTTIVLNWFCMNAEKPV